MARGPTTPASGRGMPRRTGVPVVASLRTKYGPSSCPAGIRPWRSSPSRGYAGRVPKPLAGGPELSYVVTVNGQTQMHPTGAPTLPRYVIAPGENLTITVEVTVPAHVTLTGLWLGITNGMLSPRPEGPADMSPILAARTRTPLGPGAHRFQLHWAVPAELRPGTSRQLSVQWAWPNGLAETIIAVLDVQSAPGPSSLIPAEGPPGPPPPHGRLYPDPWSGTWSRPGGWCSSKVQQPRRPASTSFDPYKLLSCANDLH
jgi:hypothetical protein